MNRIKNQEQNQNLMQKKGQEQKKTKSRGEYLFFREKPI